MVLEEATQPVESFSDAAPSNDEDPYSGDRNPTVLATRDPSHVQAAPGVYVNLNTLPKLFTPFEWVGVEVPPALNLAKGIQDGCRMASQVLERPVSQEEANALSYHLARSLRIASYGAPLGLTLGAIQCYRTAGTLRFPGWTPNPERYSPDRFTKFVRGPAARALWSSARFTAYSLVGFTLGQIFFASYALSRGSAGRLMDPRLKSLHEKIREKQKNGQTGDLMMGGRQMDRTTGPRDGETMDMARQRVRIQRQQLQQGSGDDMSPTGGSFGNEYLDMEKQQQFDTELMSDGQTQQRDRFFEQEGQRRQQQQQHHHHQHQENAARTQSRQRVDDASPAAQENAPKLTGSAWERLRQQAAPGQSQQPSRLSWGHKDTNSPPSSSGGDSFSFSQGEEDKVLAKSEAQKQFDARIEREREGKDFDDRSGGRGWRS